MRNRIMITSTLHGCEGDRQRLFPEYKFPLSKRRQADALTIQLPDDGGSLLRCVSQLNVKPL